jgi:hypothetical protein
MRRRSGFRRSCGGFDFGGERIPLINPQRGIFKPRQMEHLLSIKTVFPRRGARVWYDDQREAHQQIYAGDDVVDYQFMGTDPNSAENRWLLDAMQHQIPVIYFLGTSPGRYQPIIPTFIVGWHPERLRVQLAFGALVGASAEATLPASPERRYALREIKARFLHQASFRDAVLSLLQRSLCDLPSARTPAARCRSHHHGCGRAIRTAHDLERLTVNEAPSCGLRRPPDRDRPRSPNSRVRSAARNPRRPFSRTRPQGDRWHIDQVAAAK